MDEFQDVQPEIGLYVLAVVWYELDLSFDLQVGFEFLTAAYARVAVGFLGTG
jgi:hypothetical protein